MIARGVVFVAPFALALVAAAAVVACGGKVDSGASGVGGTAPLPPGTSPSEPPSGPSRPPRPPSADVTQIASDIADAYCKTFAGCCSSNALPPIDFARCREVTITAVTPRLAEGAKRGPAGPGDAADCVAAIVQRTSACSLTDFPWADVERPALFAPPSIRLACGVLLDGRREPPFPANTSCSAASPCLTTNQLCMIDSCQFVAQLGEGCRSITCRDGLVCSVGLCEAPGDRTLGQACGSSEDCRLGLVCAASKCDAARANPGSYEERHSPYRVGVDTCRAFATL